jgi:cytochrome d ubiquinol oxidase subunit II
MLVLWLFVLRGLGIEFRHQVDNPLWRQAWDVAFSLASILLAVLFGVALGNVLRGLPLDAFGEFQGSFAVLLNPFSILGGILALAMLGMHGAAYLEMKTEGNLQARARRTVRRLWWVAIALLAVMVAGSFPVRPDFGANFLRFPVLFVVPLFGVTCLIALRLFSTAHRERLAFLASAGAIAAVLGSAAVGLFPRLLPVEAGGSGMTLDIYNAAAPRESLRIALGVYLVGMAIVIIYLTKIYRIWRGKVGKGDLYKV